MTGKFFLPGSRQWIAMRTGPGEAEVLVYWEDITPLHDDYRHYRLPADNTPDLIARWGPDLRLRYANPALAPAPGQPLPALPGKTLAEMGDAGISGPFMAQVQRVFDTGEPLDHFHAWAPPLGERHYHTRLVAERQAGRVASVLSIGRDITTLRVAEVAASAQAQFIAQLVTASPDRGPACASCPCGRP